MHIVNKVSDNVITFRHYRVIKKGYNWLIFERAHGRMISAWDNQQTALAQVRALNVQARNNKGTKSYE